MNINEMYTDIDTNIRQSWDNDVALATGLRAVKNSMIGIITTRKGTRPFNSDFGCDISDSLFENMNPLTEHSIATSIISAIRNFEPRVSKLDVQADASMTDNSVVVSIQFSVITSPDALAELKLRLTK